MYPFISEHFYSMTDSLKKYDTLVSITIHCNLCFSVGLKYFFQFPSSCLHYDWSVYLWSDISDFFHAIHWISKANNNFQQKKSGSSLYMVETYTHTLKTFLQNSMHIICDSEFPVKLFYHWQFSLVNSKHYAHPSPRNLVAL